MKTYVYVPGFEYDSKGPVQIDAIELHARVVGSTNELSVYIGPVSQKQDDGLILANVIYRSTQSSTYLNTYGKYDSSISYKSPFYTEARSLGRVYHGFFYDFILENADGALHHVIGIHDDPQECANNVSNMNIREHDGLFAIEIDNPNTDILLDFTFYTKIVGNDAVDINMSIPVTSGYTKIYSVSKVYNPAMSANGDEGTIEPIAPKLQYFDITLQSGYYWEVPVNAGVLVTKMQQSNEMRDESESHCKMYKLYVYDLSQRKHVVGDDLPCNNKTYQNSYEFYNGFYKNSTIKLGRLENFVEKKIFSVSDLLFYRKEWHPIAFSVFTNEDRFLFNINYDITGVDTSSFSYLYKQAPSICLLNKLYDSEFHHSDIIYPLSISIDHTKILRNKETGDVDGDVWLNYLFDCWDSIHYSNKYKLSDGSSFSNTEVFQKIRNIHRDYFNISPKIEYFQNNDSYTVYNSSSAYFGYKDDISWETSGTILDRHYTARLTDVIYPYASELLENHLSDRLVTDSATGVKYPFYTATYLLFRLYGDSHKLNKNNINTIYEKSIFFDGDTRTMPLINNLNNKFGLKIDINKIVFPGFYCTTTVLADSSYFNKYKDSTSQIGDIFAYFTNMIYIDLNRSNVRFSNLGDYKIIPMFVNRTHGVDMSATSSHLVESNVIDKNILAIGQDLYEIKNVIIGNTSILTFFTPIEMGFKSSFCDEQRFIKNTLVPLLIDKTITMTPGVYVFRIQNYLRNRRFNLTIDGATYSLINNMLLMYVPEKACNVKFNSIKWTTAGFGNTTDFISGIGLYKINLDPSNLKSVLLNEERKKYTLLKIEDKASNYDLVVFKSAACAKEDVEFCKRNNNYGNSADYFVSDYGNDYCVLEGDDTVYLHYDFPYLPELACYDVVAFYDVPIDDGPIKDVKIINNNMSDDSPFITQLKSKKARI